MSIKQFRCVTNSLAIRTQPQLGDAYKTPQLLKFGDVITVDDTTRTEAAGFIWYKHDRGWSAERSSDGKNIYLLDNSLKPKDKLWGINIDPYNPTANPSAAKLAGLGWVRFVFHASSKRQTPEQAFAYYDPIIKSFVQTGTKVLLVIIQDTFWGNGPWSNGNWEAYYPGYADAIGKIALHYRGQVAAYEIWNEPDLSGQPTSIFIPPQNYGPLLQAASRAVRQADPGAKVISAGLVGSDPIGYLSMARAALGGTLPIDAIGYHPYGQTPADCPVFSWQVGTLGPSLQRLSSTFNLPVWITEYGVPRVDVNNSALWPTIANYMLKSFQMLHNAYFFICPVAIWFAWTDSQDNAGIVHDNQQQKGILYDTFFQNLRADIPTLTPVSNAPHNGRMILVQTAGQDVGEQSITELVQRVATSATNAKGLLVKSSNGATWAGASDSKKSMAINGPADLGNWSSELSKNQLDLYVWHTVSGQNVAAETALITQAALAPGVAALVLDLDPAQLMLKTSDAIRNFMIGLKRALPTTFHIDVSFDGRPENYAAVLLPDWFPFITNCQPKVFHWEYSNAQQGPESYLAATFQALKAYPKPVIPMLQAAPTAGKPVPPDQIKQAANLALGTYSAAAVSFWRLGLIGVPEFAAIQTVTVPFTAGTTPAPTPAKVLTGESKSPIRILPSASLTADVVGTLQPGEQITVLDQTVIGPLIWAHHSRGWTVIKNGQTGEVYLA